VQFCPGSENRDNIFILVLLSSHDCQLIDVWNEFGRHCPLLYVIQLCLVQQRWFWADGRPISDQFTTCHCCRTRASLQPMSHTDSAMHSQNTATQIFVQNELLCNLRSQGPPVSPDIV